MRWGPHGLAGAFVAAAVALLLCISAGEARAQEAPPGRWCQPSAAGLAEHCVAGWPQARAAAVRQHQLASRWCWAAVLSMAMAHAGLQVSQEQVVRTWYGSAVNLGLPASDLVLLAARTWRDGRGQAAHVTVEAVEPRHHALGVGAPQVLQALAEQRAVIAQLGGHAVLLTSVAYERVAGDERMQLPVRVLRASAVDPLGGSAARELGVAELGAARLVVLRIAVQ